MLTQEPIYKPFLIFCFKPILLSVLIYGDNTFSLKKTLNRGKWCHLLLKQVSKHCSEQNPAFSSKMLTQQFQFQIGAQRNVTDYQFNQKESISLRQNNGTDPRTNISPFLGQTQMFSSSRWTVGTQGRKLSLIRSKNCSRPSDKRHYPSIQHKCTTGFRCNNGLWVHKRPHLNMSPSWSPPDHQTRGTTLRSSTSAQQASDATMVCGSIRDHIWRCRQADRPQFQNFLESTLQFG